MKKRGFVIFFLFIIFFSYNVYAYSGISPAKININFEPNKESALKFKLFGYNDVDVQIGCPEYLALNKIEKFEDYQLTNFDLKFPKKMEPGKKICSIKFFDKTIELNSNGISTVTAIGGKLIINVPYQGPFAELDLIAKNIKKDEILDFYIKVTNKGDEILKDIKVIVKIFDSKNNLIDTIVTDKVSIPKFEYRDTSLIWNSKGIDSGKYKAIAELNYGGDKKAIDKEDFIIGRIFVEFLNASIKGNPNQINPFNIIVESWWGDEIKNVFADVYIKNSSGVDAGNFKTISVNLKPWEKTTLTGFWDATSWGSGEYNVKININYEENKTTIPWKYVLEIKEEKSKFWNNISEFISNPIYILIIIVLIIISIDLIYLLKRKKQK